MPKIINHEHKKTEIIQYAFDSIVENGVKGSTVRQIAHIAQMTLVRLDIIFQIILSY